jgi:uncharacterized membrane protein HdeD (DUF308 family)
MDENPPAGWYDDGTQRRRYWDGSAWTGHVAPDPAVPSRAETEQPQRPGIALGISAIVAALLGLVAVCLPWTAPELVGIVLLVAGFVLSALSLSRERAKWPGNVGLTLSVLGTILGVVMFIIGFMNGYSSAVSGN